MARISREDICGHDEDQPTVYLYCVFEGVAAVSEKQLVEMMDDPMVLELFGDWVDPYREIRGKHIGRPSICS